MANRLKIYHSKSKVDWVEFSIDKKQLLAYNQWLDEEGIIEEIIFKFSTRDLLRLRNFLNEHFPPLNRAEPFIPENSRDIKRNDDAHPDAR